MTDPKPSTNDILAKIRAKNAEAAAAEKPAAPAPSSEASAPTEAAAPEVKPAAPKGTSDILAAARAAAKPLVRQIFWRLLRSPRLLRLQPLRLGCS
jgi:hypothetical protein